MWTQYGQSGQAEKAELFQAPPPPRQPFTPSEDTVYGELTKHLKIGHVPVIQTGEAIFDGSTLTQWLLIFAMKQDTK